MPVIIYIVAEDSDTSPVGSQGGLQLVLNPDAEI